MAFWNDMFAKKSRDAPQNIPPGRRTQIGNGFNTTLSPHRSRTYDTLKTLRHIPEEAEAVNFLKRVNPDVSMAGWNFIRLANQGHEAQFYALDGKTRLTDVESQWRDFAARINEISNSGLDGLLDQVHGSHFFRGAMGWEVEVNERRNDIYDVHPVIPQTIEWELLDVKGRKKYVPYQWNMTEKVYLGPNQANFFWVPADPEIGDPRGTLNMTPVLQAIDFQMQILQDLQAVLHHQGYPKNDVSMDIEKMYALCPAHIKNDAVKLEQWFQKQLDNMIHSLETMNPDADYVHFSDTTINTNQGANAARSLDVRAVNELVDTQTLSGLKQMAIFMNRNQGVTESWGTVQFRIFCSGIASCQRGSKRLVEETMRLWLRVKGIQAIPVFKHNTIDWNSEEQRMTVEKMKQEFYAIAVLMGWVDNDVAAQEVMKVQKATGKPSENIRATFSSGGGNSGNDKHSGTKLQSDVSKANIDSMS